MTDPLAAFLGYVRQEDPKLAAQSARRVCETEGHRYQVRGKTNPTGLKCSRCGVTWAIGPRTEPTA